MSEFSIREIFGSFMPQAWSESGVVKRAHAGASAARFARRQFTSGKFVVLIAAGIASTGATFNAAAEASTSSAWVASPTAVAQGLDTALRGQADPQPRWGAVVDFISRRPKLANDYDEPEMPF